MAITNQLPASNSVIGPGDSFAFTIDATYTSLVVKIDASGGDEYAYDYALGGVQAGYTVTITDNGATHTISVSRDAGWNKEPVTVTVAENETGSIVTTQFLYYLTSTVTYPQGMQPYNDAYEGSLIVTEGDTVVRQDVGWQDYDADDFVVTDMGSGKVKVALDPSISGSDTEAIHDNVANEISAIAEKSTPASGDLLLIEDSAAGYIKKKVQITNLPSGGGGGTGDDALVYLGEYDLWETANKLNPDGNGQIVWDGASLEISYTDKNAVAYTTLHQEWQGQPLVMIDASGDRSYWTWQSTAGSGYYRDYTTFTSCDADNLWDEAGFDYGDGSGSSTVKLYSIGIGRQPLGGIALPLCTITGDASAYPGSGDSPIYDDYNNRWNFHRTVAYNTIDPTTANDETGAYFTGQLWVNTQAGNLFVCTDVYTGEWLEIISNANTVTEWGSDYTFDNTAGTPNANGEAEPNAANRQTTTSVNFYDNGADGTSQAAVWLSLNVGSTIEVYYAEAWTTWWTVTGAPTDNGTYVTVPVTDAGEGTGTFPITSTAWRVTTGSGFVKTDGTEAQSAALIRTGSTEVNASASNLGELWLQEATGAGDEYLKFTDSVGTRFALNPHIDTVAPVSGDDVNDGHEVGQIWIDTVLDDAYICLNNAAGAAVWKVIAT